MVIDWKNKVHKFDPSEFSENPDTYAEPELMYALNKSRVLLDVKMFPSRARGALARTDQGSHNSQHYAVNRKSTAVDIFAEGVPFSNFMTLYGSGLFGGLGIYVDTMGNNSKRWPMFHLDIRPYGWNGAVPLVWICYKDATTGVNKYLYPQSERDYWVSFSDPRIFQNYTWS